MKKLVKAVIAGVMIFCTASAFAQQPKFGYINMEEVVSIMPESAEAQAQLQKMIDDYSTMLESMQVEFNNKYQDYQKNAATYSDSIRQVKERELQDMDARIRQINATGEQELAELRYNLLTPILEKAENAVKKVGRDNGFTIIFDESTRPMVYYDESTLTNVLPMVKKELGITDTPATSAAAANTTK